MKRSRLLASLESLADRTPAECRAVDAVAGDGRDKWLGAHYASGVQHPGSAFGRSRMSGSRMSNIGRRFISPWVLFPWGLAIRERSATSGKKKIVTFTRPRKRSLSIPFPPTTHVEPCIRKDRDLRALGRHLGPGAVYEYGVLGLGDHPALHFG